MSFSIFWRIFNTVRVRYARARALAWRVNDVLWYPREIVSSKPVRPKNLYFIVCAPRGDHHCDPTSTTVYVEVSRYIKRRVYTGGNNVTTKRKISLSICFHMWHAVDTLAWFGFLDFGWNSKRYTGESFYLTTYNVLWVLVTVSKSPGIQDFDECSKFVSEIHARQNTRFDQQLRLKTFNSIYFQTEWSGCVVGCTN